MKKFESLSELDILHLVYDSLLEKWGAECEKNEKFVSMFGRENIIAKHHANIYWQQLEEIRPEILRLEKLAEK